jgi:hypothetical protein
MLVVVLVVALEDQVLQGQELLVRVIMVVMQLPTMLEAAAAVLVLLEHKQHHL